MFFFSSRRRHTRSDRDWSSDVCSSDLESDIADQLAGSTIADVIVPRPETHEGYGGPIFYSKAKLRMIQLVDRETKKLSEPQTIPPYFSSCRHATRDDVERIYEVTETSATLGTITGVEPFHVQLD